MTYYYYNISSITGNDYVRVKFLLKLAVTVIKRTWMLPFLDIVFF